MMAGGHRRGGSLAQVLPGIGYGPVGLWFLMGAAAGMVLGVSCGRLAAEESIREVVRSASELRAMGPEALGKRAPVRLRGVVVYSGRVGFILSDAGHCVEIVPPAGETKPVFGDLVEVAGETGVNPIAGRHYPLVRAAEVRIVGKSDPPEPVPATVPEIAAFRHWNQWVRTRGVVVDQSWLGGEHHIMLGTAEGWAVIHVRESARSDFSPDYIGAVIEASGINQGFDHSANNAMMVPNPRMVKVVRAGGEPFSIPVSDPASLSPDGTLPAAMVRVRGTVTLATASEGSFLRAESGDGVRFSGIFPVFKPSPQTGEASAMTVLPELRAGDRVDVVGIPVRQGGGLWLRYGQARVVEAGGTRPVPVEASVPDVLDGRHASQWVRIRGRLAERYEVPLSLSQFRNILVIEAGGRFLRIFFETSAEGTLSKLEVNDLIRLDGVVAVPGNGEPLRLLLASPDDAVSLGVAPQVWIRRLWIWGGVSAAAISLMGLWAVSLRRSIARSEAAEAAVRALNATLEEKVDHRTAQLEKAREELAEALSQERDLGQLKSRFIAMVSHEFRTPLGVTMSALELLRHHMDRLPKDKQTELLNDIFDSTLRMSGLMEQVLLLGRVEAGKMAFKPAPVDLGELCAKLVDESRSATGRREGIEFSVEGDLENAWMDSGLVRHIVGNLLSNAVKYSPPGGRIEFRVRRDGGVAELVVSDEGIGIPKEDQARLFDAFFRASNVGDSSGTGLGLLLVKRCVEVHSGEIRFQSEAGVGTTFTVRLPLGGPAPGDIPE